MSKSPPYARPPPPPPPTPSGLTLIGALLSYNEVLLVAFHSHSFNFKHQLKLSQAHTRGLVVENYPLVRTH